MTKKNICRAVIGVLGIALVTVGLIQGGYGITMNKAIRVCLECIGIG